MTDERRDRPSAFSVYASRFLAGNLSPAREQSSQIFRPPSPGSPTHDPFVPSPDAAQSHPHLAGSGSGSGSSRSTSPSLSPARTPPFPGGVRLDAIPDISDSGVSSGIGMGLLFAAPEDAAPAPAPPPRQAGSAPMPVPNPYEPSSESEPEADLDEVADVRRSLVRSQRKPGPPRTERAKKGWMAYQSIFPPSSSSSESDESDKETESESDNGAAASVAADGRMGRSRHKQHREHKHCAAASELLSPSALMHANTYANGADLHEPLLHPTDGARVEIPNRLQVYHGRFGHWEREGLRKYKDSGFLALWLTSLLGVIIGLCFVWGSTDPPVDAPDRTAPSLLPLLPLLLILLIPTLALPPAFLYLLRRTVRPVLAVTAAAIPFSLFVCGWWALGASFETAGLDGVDSGERWWGTTGMRIGAGLLWALAAWFGRMMWLRRKRLERTAAVVELSTHLLLTHPPLLLLTPLLLAVFAVTSIPFLTLLIRLGTIGYWRHPRENTWIFHIRPYAGWLIFLVTLVWVWTWSVIRGVGRVAVAGVVGEWYFHRQNKVDPVEITMAAVHRATGASLGSICLGALIVATVRVVGRTAAELRRVTSPRSNVLPSALSFLTSLTPFFAIVAGVLDQLNGYALVYVGVTGDAFWPSARRAVGLAGKRKGGRLLDYTLIKLLLTLSSTALGMFTATAGYLYMTHSLSSPGYAPVAALLCGGVPFLAVRAGAAVLADAADALFICHQIDREAVGEHYAEAKEAFNGELPRGDAAA
ncbi:hypothetical protein Q5752_006410 [Cryptotrichosporon argae]